MWSVERISNINFKANKKLNNNRICGWFVILPQLAKIVDKQMPEGAQRYENEKMKKNKTKMNEKMKAKLMKMSSRWHERKQGVGNTENIFLLLFFYRIIIMMIIIIVIIWYLQWIHISHAQSFHPNRFFWISI